jgi:hypothetical protein
MSKVSDYLDTLNLTDGLSFRGMCPMCHARNDFSATNKDGVIVYNCYKLSCNVKGAYGSGLTATEIQAKINAWNVSVEGNKKKELERMVLPEYVVSPKPEHKLFHRFVNRWNIQGEDLMYDVKDRRCVFPCTSNGKLVDATTKCIGIPNGTILVVEDVISAITAARVCPGLTAMALLGTSLTEDHKAKIGEYSRVIVALDPDAVPKTLTFTREIVSWTGLPTSALRLDDDIKYALESDIQKLKEFVS